MNQTMRIWLIPQCRWCASPPNNQCFKSTASFFNHRVQRDTLEVSIEADRDIPLALCANVLPLKPTLHS